MKLKKTLSLILAGVMLAGAGQTLALAEGETQTLTKDMELMIGLGLMSTDSEGNAYPDAAFTRLEMAQLVANTVEYAENYDALGGTSSLSQSYDPWTFFEGATDYVSGIEEKLSKWEKSQREQEAEEKDGAAAEDKAEESTGGSVSERLERINTKIYNDIEVTSPNYELTKKVSAYGIMNGFDDGNFYPGKHITVMDAAVTIMNMLGYGRVVKYHGGYPDGYMEIASAIGLDIINPTSTITRKQLAAMYADALETGVLDTSLSGPYVVISNEDSETILEKFMQLETVKGRIVQNEQTSLSGKSTLNENGLQIGEYVLFTNDKTEYAQGFIGRTVECYYFNEDSDRENEVVYVRKTKDGGELSFPIDDFVSYIGTKITYNYGERTKSASTTEYPFYIYNGVAVTSCPDSYFESAQGTVTLVSGDGSSKYDLVVIEGFETKYVSSAYEYGDDFIITNKLKTSDVLTFAKDDIGRYVKIFNAAGEKADFTDIKSDMVIDVMQNGDVIEIRIADEVVYDFELKGKNTTGGVTVSNGKVKYELSNDYVKSAAYKEPAAGTDYDLYLNTFGKGAYLSEVGSVGMKLGYLIKLTADDNDEKVYAKIIVGDRTAASYELAEKIYFSNNDGTINNKRIAAYDTYEANLKGMPNQVVRYTVNAQKQITALELALDYGVESNSDNRLRVRVQTDGDSSDYTYFFANNTIGRKIYMSTDTPILTVPAAGTTDVSKFKVVNYNALTKGTRKMTAYSTSATSPLADYVLYFDEANAVYQEGTSNEYIVTDVVETINENDEVVIKIDTFYRGTKSTFYITENSDLYKGLLPVPLALKTTSDGIKDSDYIMPDKGDIISINADTSGNITNGAVVFDADGTYNASRYKDRYEASTGYSADKFTGFDWDFKYNEKGILAGTIGRYVPYVTNTNPFSADYKNGAIYYGGTVTSYGWQMGTKRFMLAYVYSVDGNYVTVTTKNLRELGSELPEIKKDAEFLVETYEFSSRFWHRADLTNNKSITAEMLSDAAQIKSYKEYGKNCSRILISTGSTAFNNAYIIDGNIK